jgi:DNA-binding CsgD family transcriptional regulator
MLTKEQALLLLHSGMWTEDLLGENFMFTVERVLYPKERQILEMKVQDYSDEYICNVLKVTEATLVRTIRHIKQILRLGFRTRIDDHRKVRTKYDRKIQCRRSRNHYRRDLGTEQDEDSEMSAEDLFGEPDSSDC